MKQIHVTVAAIIEKNHKFLMVKEKDPFSGLVFNQPAGHLEIGESLTDAISREVLEETGYQFYPKALVGIYLQPASTHPVTYLRHCFVGNIGEKIQNQLDPDIISANWMSLDEINEVQCHHRSSLVKQCLNDYLSGQSFPLNVLKYFPEEKLAL